MEIEYSFVSGATGGIGKAFCFELLKNNNNLFLTGRSEQKLIVLKNQLLNINSKIKIEYFACQLEDENDRKKMFNYIQSLNIKFNRLCNIAGVDIQKAFKKYAEEKIIKQIRVNLESTLSITKFVLDNRASNLQIVTISSMSSVYPMPYFAIYSSTKSALNSFFMSLRLELKSENVKMTLVKPGGVFTRQDIIEDIKGQGFWGKLSAKTPEYIAKKSLKAVQNNKRTLIPGFFNKFLAYGTKIIPLNFKMKFIARRWKKLEKDAF